MSLLDQMLALDGPPPEPEVELDDLDRILALPRRPVPTEAEQEQMAAEMTKRLAKPEGPCACRQLRPEVVARKQDPCIKTLRPIQGWYLYEASKANGALGPIAVGGGKTGIDILTPMVVPGCQLAVLLIPPGLKAQLLADYRVWSQHFIVPTLVGGPGPWYTGRPRLEILPYSQLSHENNSTWLRARKPDVIIADEVQALKDSNATRTGRFLRYFAGNPATKFFCHSGSITTRSILDYAHLSALSLKESSPLPIDKGTAEDWALALDPLVGASASSAPSLKALCAPGESARRGFFRRLVETRGVVATVDARLPIGLEFFIRNPPPMPAEVEDALAEVRQGRRPDGEELIDEFEIAACARQVAAGFYLYWAYPRGEPEELILYWFKKRQAWNCELRDRLKRREDDLDSPGLLMKAAERHHEGIEDEEWKPTWDSYAWPAWSAIRGQVKPVTRVEWIDDWLLKDAVAWGRESPGVIWYLNQDAGRRLAQMGGFPLYTSGKKEGDEFAKEKGDRTIVASLKAFGTGFNMQAWSSCLYFQMSADGGAYEQSIGRFHRPGQPADCVRVTFYSHCEEYERALEKAEEYCRYVRDTTGMPQKLLTGVWK